MRLEFLLEILIHAVPILESKKVVWFFSQCRTGTKEVSCETHLMHSSYSL